MEKLLAVGNPGWVGDETVSLLHPTLDVQIRDRHKSSTSFHIIRDYYL
jgi:hypothetical protein